MKLSVRPQGHWRNIESAARRPARSLSARSSYRLVTEFYDKPSVDREHVGSRVRVVEKDDELSIETPRMGWDVDTGPRLVGGLILLLVGLLRSWVTSLGAPDLPAMLVWYFPFLGAWLLWRGLVRGFVSTRICLAPTSGAVEWSLVGPLRSFVEIDICTLEVQSKRNDEAEVDMRLVFPEPQGKDRRIRILRGYGATECDQVASIIGAWIDKHRPAADEANPKECP
jgi:hypothetical protein